jgi:signal transduction histidine kinase
VVIKAVDRRRYERELVEARALATESLKSKRETADLREQFIAVLGHDLRNPLAAIARAPASCARLRCEFPLLFRPSDRVQNVNAGPLRAALESFDVSSRLGRYGLD